MKGTELSECKNKHSKKEKNKSETSQISAGEFSFFNFPPSLAGLYKSHQGEDVLPALGSIQGLCVKKQTPLSALKPTLQFEFL